MKKLERSMTFVEPKAHRSSSFDFQPLVRSNTFAPGSTKDSSLVESMSFEDVLYRKHFGSGPQLVKASSLNVKGMKYVLDQDSSSSVPPIPRDSKNNAQDYAVVVDTFTTGAMVAHRFAKSGYKVVCLLSSNALGHLLALMPEGLNLQFAATIIKDENENLSSLSVRLNAVGKIKYVVAGAETGVELADALSEHMGLTTNGTIKSQARRDKYIMGETVRSAGVRAVKQLKTSKWGEVEAYLQAWNPQPFKVILKPVDSAGSDGVTLCQSMEECQKAFGDIIGKTNVLGLVNEQLLVQEYLEGTEYVVDMVSREGEHKCVAIWEYDRRAANGAGFVAFGQRLLTMESPRAQALLAYQRKVLTALGINYGPSHGEVKWHQGEPVLVEVGSRCHGAEGFWMPVADAVYGYNQVECAIDSFTSPANFRAIPSSCESRKAWGGLKFLISHEDGVLKNLGAVALEEIKSMRSYRGHQLFAEVGEAISRTQNCLSWAGCVKLVHEDEAIYQADYNRIEELESIGGGLFEVQPIVKEKAKAVVLVDPFSTGAVVAHRLNLRGYRVIAVYGTELDKLEKVKNLVPKGVPVVFEEVFAFENGDISSLCDKFKHDEWEVVNVIAGCETGVELADKLADHLGLACNDINLTVARRNKYDMGETVRSAGVRAPKQMQSSKWGEVEAYLQAWNPQPFKVILKPVDSAGSDGVTLCQSMEECQKAFGDIIGKTNVLGLVNEQLLVQEYLEGTEYVVDMVSREGEHKCVAIWEYDRRAANGAGFVAFGQRLLTMESPRAQALLAYQRKVLTALGINYGPSHGEVKWHQGEPVLVEVGSRCHGAEGFWMPVADAVYGYNQVECAIDSYEKGPSAYSAMPESPLKRYSWGYLLFFVVYKDGLYHDADRNMVEEITSMKSFLNMEIFLSKGETVRKTTDCTSWGGVVSLANTDREMLHSEVERLREMEASSLFAIECIE